MPHVRKTKANDVALKVFLKTRQGGNSESRYLLNTSTLLLLMQMKNFGSVKGNFKCKYGTKVIYL